MEKAKLEILELLERYGIEAENVQSIDKDGVSINKNLFVQILEIIRTSNEYSSIRGHVRLDSCFNVSYEGKHLSYERLSDIIYVDKAEISYHNSENEYKIYISKYNWIDLYVKYSEQAYATVVVIPKSKSN